MPGRLFEIRYPNGDFEMSAFTQQRPPEIGETLRRNHEPFVMRVEPLPDRGKAEVAGWVERQGQ